MKRGLKPCKGHINLFRKKSRLKIGLYEERIETKSGPLVTHIQQFRLKIGLYEERIETLKEFSLPKASTPGLKIGLYEERIETFNNPLRYRITIRLKIGLYEERIETTCSAVMVPGLAW